MATGCEGRFSNLKSGYSWGRTRIDTSKGENLAETRVFAHNLTKIAALCT